MAIGAGEFRAHEEEAKMIRIALLGLIGYIAYRVGREFIARVPDDFEPVPLLPPPSPVTNDGQPRRKTTPAG